MNGQSLAVSNEWLNDLVPDTSTHTVSSSLTVGDTFTLGNGCYQTCVYPSYYYWTTPAPRPIKLTMSEVERLRKAARADGKLKSILAKFTDQIEVVVDFE